MVDDCAGAVVTFSRVQGIWSQQDLVSWGYSQNFFGNSVAFSKDGDILAVGAPNYSK